MVVLGITNMGEANDKLRREVDHGKELEGDKLALLVQAVPQHKVRCGHMQS